VGNCVVVSNVAEVSDVAYVVLEFVADVSDVAGVAMEFTSTRGRFCEARHVVGSEGDASVPTAHHPPPLHFAESKQTLIRLYLRMRGNARDQGGLNAKT